MTTEKQPTNIAQPAPSSRSVCDCGGEIMEVNADTGYCLQCGCEWTAASVVQHLYSTAYSDDDSEIPF